MNILYKASATSTGGRDGRAVSSDNALDVKGWRHRVNSAEMAQQARIPNSCLQPATRPVS
ncbi:organic hydroperoxide reductase OsmC/OhrA [Paraburkholderia sp. WSM4179]|nr:organic hydroperoxide reductase OsmC/OhrA [Paraburkholderia sp. WSM4179]